MKFQKHVKREIRELLTQQLKEYEKKTKMHYATHRHTATELIYERANADKEHMGLTYWENAPDGKIVKSDVSIAKNYLTEEEINFIERVVSMYLDYAEMHAERHIPMSMEDWSVRLDGFLEFNGTEVFYI